MDAIEMIKERRSVRNFKDEKVDRELMKEIVDIAKWSPSWVNYQVARYTLIDNEEIIEKIANDCVKGFAYNTNTLKNAKGVAVLSFVKGKSGKLEQYGIEESANNTWEIFDAGIACQTFCLAAHAKGIGTCIMGVINEDSIAKVINLPEEETVAALIVYGYPDGEIAPSKRKDTEEIMRFFDK